MQVEANFSDKDAVIGIGNRLMLVGQIRMNRMTHFMCQRKHAVQCARIIEQDIRMLAQTGRICAGAFADVLININPAIVKAFLENRTIVITHTSEGVIYGLFGFFIRNIDIHIADNRRVQIIHVQFIDTKQLAAQIDIAIHRRHVFVYRRNQIGVYFGRHIVSVQRCLQRRIILAGIGIEL